MGLSVFGRGIRSISRGWTGTALSRYTWISRNSVTGPESHDGPILSSASLLVTAPHRRFSSLFWRVYPSSLPSLFARPDSLCVYYSLLCISVYLYICISVYPVYRYILWWTCQASPPFPPSSFSLPLSLLDHSPSLSRLNNADHQKQIAVRDRCCSTENAFFFRSCTSHDSMVLGHGLWTGPFLGSTQDG